MIDLHNDALLALPPRKLLPYLRRAKAAGVDEIWLSVWTTKLSDPMTTIKSKHTLLSQIAGKPEYPLCRLHIEDAWFLTPENLSELIALKPHSVGLTWNAANCLAGGAYSKTGITSWGYQVIKELEVAGIQVDVAHLNRKSFYQFARVTTRPIICTHTAFNAVRHHCRNLTKRQIQTIIKSHGYLGLCLVPEFLTKNTISCGIYEILKHINYFKIAFPEAKLYWGADFYGTDLPYGIQDYHDIINLFNAKIIGYSAMRQPLLAYQIGDPNATRRILVTGGMHAREWITKHVVTSLMHEWQDLPQNTCVVFIPECNPDGIRLATTGLTPFFRQRRKFLTHVNHGSTDFTLWKANARAVDLNVNYDVGWGQGANNINTPAPANYIGRRPNSEPETRAILRFIKHFQPTVGLAFHSKGEIIYCSRTADWATAQKLGEITQYQPQFSSKSFGGLTDYLALKRNIPAFTIEVGADTLKHPIKLQHLPEIVNRVKKIIYFLIGA